jgi:hypothetical protein
MNYCRKNRLLTRVMCSLLLVVACDCAAAAEQSLFALLPEQTSVAVAVNDFAQAVAINADAEPEDDPNWWGDFAKTFGLAPQPLAEATVGGLLRAEIYVAHRWQQVAVVKVDAQRIAPLLKSYRPHDEPSPQFLVHGEHLIMATAAAAAKAIKLRLEAADDRISLTGEKQLALEGASDEHDGLRVTWYTAPWLKEKLRSEQDEQAKPSKQFTKAQRHGITGIKSLGGVVVYKDGLPASARTSIYAPRPWSATLQMFSHFQPRQDLRLPAWVPGDVDHVEVASLDLPQAFEHIDALFDDSFADGIAGTYRDVVEDLQIGLEVNLKKDVYTHMGRQICLLQTRTKETSQNRILYAFETKNPNTASEAVQRLMEGDGQHQKVVVAGHKYPMWLVGADKPGGEDFVFMVAHGCIFYTNDAKLMHRVLKPAADTTLAKHKELRQTFDAMITSAAQPPSFFAMRGDAKEMEATETEHTEPPLRMLFAGPKTSESSPDEDFGDFLSTIIPNGENFRVSVGYAEENGWRIDSRTLSHPGEKGN